jgi:uncharacterized protein (DUF736 family)
MLRRIGCFKKQGEDFIGEIATVDFKTNARFAPVENKTSPACPDYLIVHSETSLFSPELGVAWKRTNSEGSEYLDVVIDDPTYSHPISAVLFKGRYDGALEVWNLFWSRSTTTTDMAEKVEVHEELIPYIGVIRPISKVTDYLLAIYPSLPDDANIELDYD